MNKFRNPTQQENVAVFLVRLALELRKNSNYVGNDRFNRFV